MSVTVYLLIERRGKRTIFSKARFAPEVVAGAVGKRSDRLKGVALPDGADVFEVDKTSREVIADVLFDAIRPKMEAL